MFGAEPTEVFASSIDGARSNMPEIDEMTSGLMRFDGDRLATFTTSFNANGVSDFRVVGTEGNIHAEPAYEYAEALGYTLTVGDERPQEEGPPPRSVRRGDLLLLGLRAERQGSGTVGRRRLLGRARRQRALSVSGDAAEPVELQHFGPEEAPISGKQGRISRRSREPELVAVEKPHD